MDRSKAFLSQARAGAAAGEEYVTADVAVAPLRIAGIGAQPDLIYARFLSSHLPEPEQAVAGWAKELAAGGLLLLALLADSQRITLRHVQLATASCNCPRSLISTRQHSADRLLVRSVVSSWAKHP